MKIHAYFAGLQTTENNDISTVTLNIYIYKKSRYKIYRIMSDYGDDFMADDEDYDLEYSEDSNSGIPRIQWKGNN